MPLEWSASRRAYIRNKRPVPESQIRQTVQEAITSGKRTVAGLTASLIDKGIDSAEWASRMREEVRAAHRAAAMIANGGRLTPSAAGKLGAALREQYKYLDRLINDIYNGDVTPGPRLGARAQLYIQAAYNTYNNAVVAREIRAGVKRGKWVMSVVEHCAGCLAQAKKGVQPLTAFPPIGSQTCLVNCRCHIEAVTKA